MDVEVEEEETAEVEVEEGVDSQPVEELEDEEEDEVDSVEETAVDEEVPVVELADEVSRTLFSSNICLHKFADFLLCASTLLCTK